MKKKNTKKDLIWIIPEIIGSIGICIIGAIHITKFPIETVGFMEFIFQSLLAMMIVLNVGFKGVGHGCEELKEVIN